MCGAPSQTRVDLELASYLRIEERELTPGERN